MNYIVFDLEWNQPYSNDISFMKRTKMPLTGEIIQIGAVKLNEKMDIVDHFTMFITNLSHQTTIPATDA